MSEKTPTDSIEKSWALSAFWGIYFLIFGKGIAAKVMSLVATETPPGPVVKSFDGCEQSFQ